MEYKLLRNIAKRFSASGNNRRFLNFARMVAFISVILGSMALIISLSVLDGFENALKSNAVKFTSHIKLKAFDSKPIENYPVVMKKIKDGNQEIVKIAPVIEKESLVSTKSYVEGIVVRGTLPKYDITDLKKNIIEGKFAFSSESSNEIIIGKRLANKLNVNISDEIVVYALQGEELTQMLTPEIEKFKVTGIYETGMVQYDDIFAYIPFKKALVLYNQSENSATSFDMILKDINQAKIVSERLNKQLGYPYYAFSVFDLHNAMFAWIELQKAPIPLVLGLISIVAVLNIITILLITVVEKTHSIGILSALGMSKKNIIKIFILQGVSIGIVGTLIGCAMGLAFGLVQQQFGIISLEGEIYFLDKLPVHFEAWHFAVVILTATLLSFLATLIPSFIASSIKPIKALRFK